jgi:hypothetical protein
VGLARSLSSDDDFHLCASDGDRKVAARCQTSERSAPDQSLVDCGVARFRKPCSAVGLSLRNYKSSILRSSSNQYSVVGTSAAQIQSSLARLCKPRSPLPVVNSILVQLGS